MLLFAALACNEVQVPDDPETELTADDCRDLYTIEAGYGYDDDELWQLSAKSPEMIVDYYCPHDDRACDADLILTRETAKCIAQVEGVEDHEPDMELHYRGPDNTLWWVVEGLEFGERGAASYGGLTIEVDAWGVEPVERGDWDQSDCQSGFG
ncbi:MAG: hypothetical protein GY913_30860 [Proteobacteria bacterium]|nr:hypothetical protein [Pseudomonadota bacterium]MCP4921318.1 hypothetical protein [Pseudomonadota bacterium]